MVHRRSPARIAKQRRVIELAARPPLRLPTTTVTADRLAGLESGIWGRIVLPGEADYNAARQQSNPAFQEYPQIIVYCVVETDVAACLSFARQAGLAVSLRSGGHSTAGYAVNSGMTIDVSEMASLTIDRSAPSVTVQPGIDFDTFNAALEGTGLHVPSGACGNVRVGGFVQGGGYGYTSRAFGMQCDNVLAMRVMLASGRIVAATATQNADLYWAMRGGTGGNFGVLLEITFRLYPLPSVWACGIAWPMAEAAGVLALQQARFMRSGAPPGLGYMMNVGFNAGEPVAMMQAMWCGDQAEGMQALAPLLDFGHAKLLASASGTYGKMDAWLDNNPYAIPNPPDGSCEDKICGYIDRPLAATDWQDIVDFFNTTPNRNNVLYTEPYGGAIAQYPVADSAFIHRAVDMDLVIDAFWSDAAEGAQVKAWLDGFEVFLKPYFNGQAYQNYPRRSYVDFRELYWGEAFDRLLVVKRKYDPENFFSYQQSISAASGIDLPARPGVDGIVYEAPAPA